MATARDERPPPEQQPVTTPALRVTQHWLGWAGWVAKRCRGLVVYATLDPASISAGGRRSYTVVVSGARPGQWAMATHSATPPEVTWNAEVTADDEVTATAWNATGTAAVDVPSGTLRVRVGDMI